MISIIKAKAMLADSQFIYVVSQEDVSNFEPTVPVRYTHVDGIFLYGADIELTEFKGKEIQPFGEDFDIVEEVVAVLEAPIEVAGEVLVEVVPIEVAGEVLVEVVPIEVAEEVLVEVVPTTTA